MKAEPMPFSGVENVLTSPGTGVIGLAFAAFAGVRFLLAQASGIDGGFEFAESLIGPGFAAFVAWWMITKSLPKLTDDFRSELQLVRDQHKAERAEDREEFRSHIERLAQAIESRGREGE